MTLIIVGVVIFCVGVGIGVYLMLHTDLYLEFFK